MQTRMYSDEEKYWFHLVCRKSASLKCRVSMKISALIALALLSRMEPGVTDKESWVLFLNYLLTKVAECWTLEEFYLNQLQDPVAIVTVQCTNYFTNSSCYALVN